MMTVAAERVAEGLAVGEGWTVVGSTVGSDSGGAGGEVAPVAVGVGAGWTDGGVVAVGPSEGGGDEANGPQLEDHATAVPPTARHRRAMMTTTSRLWERMILGGVGGGFS